MDRWTIEPVGDHRVVARIDGELDVTNGPDLVDFLAKIMNVWEGTVEVDLSGVSFIDSSGLHTLIAGHQLLVERGTALTIVNPSDCVRRLLELTGCTQVFRVVHGETQLLDSHG